MSSEQRFENTASKNHTFTHSLPSQHTRTPCRPCQPDTACSSAGLQTSSGHQGTIPLPPPHRSFSHSGRLSTSEIRNGRPPFRLHFPPRPRGLIRSAETYDRRRVEAQEQYSWVLPCDHMSCLALPCMVMVSFASDRGHPP